MDMELKKMSIEKLAKYFKDLEKLKKDNTHENTKILLISIMSQLGITDEDLKSKPSSWIKSKIREFNIDRILKD